MKINQQGITRLVFITDKYAIKVPRVTRGWSMLIQGIFSNLSEANCWKNNCFDGHTSPTLCPVKFSFMGFILIMPRVSICSDASELPEAEDPGEDRHYRNYGWYMGRVVCVDYPFHRIKPYKR